MGMFFLVFSFLTGKYWAFFPPAQQEKKTWIFLLFFNSPGLSYHLAGCLEDVRLYFLQLKMGISQPAKFTRWNLEGSSPTFSAGRKAAQRHSVGFFGENHSSKLVLFWEYRH